MFEKERIKIYCIYNFFLKQCLLSSSNIQDIVMNVLALKKGDCVYLFVYVSFKDEMLTHF